MKTNELRINNWVNDEGRFCQITMIQDGFINFKFDGLLIQSFSDDIDPIPITKEWLIKFGFKSECDYIKEWYNIDLKDKNTLSININQNTYCIGSIQWSEWTYPSSIYYVHQVQNLYFALTGEELTIK